MFGPTQKYRNLATDPIDGTPISWSSHPDGFPIRQGDAPGLIEKSRLEHAGVNPFARSEVFVIPDDMEKYVKAVDWIANSGGVLRFEKVKETEKGWLVWLSWFDLRGYIPNNTQMAAVVR